MKKQIALGTLVALSLVTLSACTVDKSTEKTPTNDVKKDNITEDLSSFIYQNTKGSLYYSGTLDYAHSLTVKEVDKQKQGTTIRSEIALYKLMEEEEGAEDEFYKQDVVYTIGKDFVKESLKEANYDDPKNFVPNKVILKTPLKEGNEWTQEVTLPDGYTYVAETKIESVTGKRGERKVATVLTISGEGFEDYPVQQYKEKSIYQEGKGLVSFERFYPNEEGGFVFEYHLDKK